MNWKLSARFVVKFFNWFWKAINSFNFSCGPFQGAFGHLTLPRRPYGGHVWGQKSRQSQGPRRSLWGLPFGVWLRVHKAWANARPGVETPQWWKPPYQGCDSNCEVNGVDLHFLTWHHAARQPRTERNLSKPGANVKHPCGSGCQGCFRFPWPLWAWAAGINILCETESHKCCT